MFRCGDNEIRFCIGNELHSCLIYYIIMYYLSYNRWECVELLTNNFEFVFHCQKLLKTTDCGLLILIFHSFFYLHQTKFNFVDVHDCVIRFDLSGWKNLVNFSSKKKLEILICYRIWKIKSVSSETRTKGNKLPFNRLNKTITFFDVLFTVML